MLFTSSQDDLHEEGIPLTEEDAQDEDEDLNEIEVNQSKHITDCRAANNSRSSDNERPKFAYVRCNPNCGRTILFCLPT